ncbi:MAG TPA: hypothetical protein VN420_01710 [Candidatus Fimivivens sp.]|nr:hypothetical protein [Candidatus Fimivivens sp.]
MDVPTKEVESRSRNPEVFCSGSDPINGLISPDCPAADGGGCCESPEVTGY